MTNKLKKFMLGVARVFGPGVPDREDFRVDCEEFHSRSYIGAVQIRSPCR